MIRRLPPAWPLPASELLSTVADLLYLDEALRGQPCFPAQMWIRTLVDDATPLPVEASPQAATGNSNAKPGGDVRCLYYPPHAPGPTAQEKKPSHHRRRLSSPSKRSRLALRLQHREPTRRPRDGETRL